MLTDSAKHLIDRLTAENLAVMLFNLSWCIKQRYVRSPFGDFSCPETIEAKWFEDEVNNLLLDQQLDLIKDLADRIKATRHK